MLNVKLLICSIKKNAKLIVRYRICKVRRVTFLFDRPVTGASMNPVRTLGPAFVHNEYRGIWIYLLSPILGAIAGAWVYNTVRYTNKPLREITQSASFLREAGRGGHQIV